MTRIRTLLSCMTLTAVLGCGEDSKPATAPGPTPAPFPTTHDLVFEGVLDTIPEILAYDPADGSVRRWLAPGTVAMDPTPSPDGAWIAFVTANYDSGVGDIWVMRRDGSELRQVTSDPELDDQPTWSPDGEKLAFRSFRTGRDGDIWVMDKFGGNLVNLTPDPLPGITDERRPAWSPDGTRIAFASNAGGNIDIWTMAPDGSDWRRITDTIELDTEPAWSPDGSHLAFRRSGASGSDLCIVSAAGGAVTPIPMSGEQRMPIWFPDGTRLAFVSQATLSARPDLYFVSTGGSFPELLVGDSVPGGSIHPAFLKRP